MPLSIKSKKREVVCKQNTAARLQSNLQANRKSRLEKEFWENKTKQNKLLEDYNHVCQFSQGKARGK